MSRVSGLPELRAGLAALQMRWALMKLAWKYRPDQPRVPAGSPDGGQWTDAGGSGWTRIAANDRGEGGTATDVRDRSSKPVTLTAKLSCVVLQQMIGITNSVEETSNRCKKNPAL